MEHVLDNPAWHALATNNSNLAHGNEHVKYFAKEVSPFFGLEVNSAENFQVLYDMENVALYQRDTNGTS
jgi:hypothetical protein